MEDVYSQTLQSLGLTSDDVNTGTFTTGDKPGLNYLSTRPDFVSVLPAKSIVLNSLEQLQEITGTMGNTTMNSEVPEPWPDNKSVLKVHELSEADEQNLYAALRVCLSGRQNEVSSYADILNKRYFPMSANVFASDNIVVTPGNPLVISPQGHDPVIVTCDTLTLEQGGQIICEAPVVLTCNTFIKN